jgi:hypothetical protein
MMVIMGNTTKEEGKEGDKKRKRESEIDKHPFSWLDKQEKTEKVIFLYTMAFILIFETNLFQQYFLTVFP